MRLDVAGTFRKLANGVQQINIPLNVSGLLDIRSGALQPSALTMTSSSTLALTVGGPTPVTQFSRVHAGTASLGGTLRVTSSNGYQPSAGTTLDVMTFASRSGSFDKIEPVGFAGLQFHPQFGNGTLSLAVQ